MRSPTLRRAWLGASPLFEQPGGDVEIVNVMELGRQETRLRRPVKRLARLHWRVPTPYLRSGLKRHGPLMKLN